jgi:predicted amidophosphoribosyltransferase
VLENVLNLLFPRFNLNYSSFSEYLTDPEINSFKSFSKKANNPNYKDIDQLIQVCCSYKNPIVEDLIIRAKVQGELDIINSLVKLVQIKQDKLLKKTDLITFTPPDPVRFEQRGYHLPELITKKLAKQNQIQKLNLLYKPFSTPSQTSLNKLERNLSLKDKFIINPNLNVSLSKYNYLLVLDDVTTTGSTFLECTKIIRQNFPFLRVSSLAIAG